MLVFTPLILSWRAGTVAWTASRVAEAALFGVLLVVSVDFVFTAAASRTFLVVPFIVWAAFRFGQRGVTTAIAVVSAMALWYTLERGRGPFAGQPMHEALLLLLLFVGTLVFTGLALCAVLRQLDVTMGELESRVRSRTAELEEAKLAAERANEAKSQFLANMSHELRTPLNSLLILARLLADNANGNLDREAGQVRADHPCLGPRPASLINDLLDLAKIESGAVTALHVAPTRFADLRDDLERTFRQVAQERKLEFSIVLDPALPPSLRTDAGRLKQVLKNLLANAFKFTNRGGVTLRIAGSAGHRGIRRHRHRYRHCAGQAAAHLRGVPSGRRLHQPPLRRHRSRAIDQPRADAAPERRAARCEPPGRGKHVHARAAARRRARDRAVLLRAHSRPRARRTPPPGRAVRDMPSKPGRKRLLTT